MGGKNHQPCNTYIKTSTQMSRYASIAFASLELANVALEDLILAEIDGGIGNIDAVEQQVGNSRKNISQLIIAIDKLEIEMDHNNFRDLFTIRPIDLGAVGDSLITANMVDAKAWDQVSENTRSGGFRKNLKVIRTYSISLAEHTDRLGVAIKALRSSAEKGIVLQVFEENLNGNLKPEFAKLYFEWNKFQEFFIASSLLSTEVYYAFNKYGSLVNASAQKSVA